MAARIDAKIPPESHRRGGGGLVEYVRRTNTARATNPDSEGKTHTSRRLATHLELPVGRLEELLRLVCGAASRQNKLVDHDLVPEFVHIYRHDRSLLDARAFRSRKRNKKSEGGRLGRTLGTFRPSPASLRPLSLLRSLQQQQ